MKNDFTNSVGTKIDFYSIIKRRKRNVGSFLSEYGISSVEQLEAVFSRLSNDYLITEEFRTAAIKCLSVPETKSENPSETLDETPVEDPALITTDHEQKPKKRSKKES